ncbi:MAG: DUF3667 domain-containing protein [Flavobacteriaceae bacterium]|jgi:hypothetical protein|nr:DUF3667 domain-containing protein [Flavobacteriaceae bacterium]
MKPVRKPNPRKKQPRKYCLNCGKEIDDNFCSGCGQKTSTHRISFRHFLMHDLLHGTFHFERGMFFTAKEALLRPGKAALDYISGKRVKYYNIFYFILFMIGINIFLGSIGETTPENIKYSSEIERKLEEFTNNYEKYIFFCFIPFLAFNSFILFRRKKLNFSEHIIVSAFIFLGVLIIIPINNIPQLFPKSIEIFLELFGYFILTPGFMAFGYYNTFRKDYKLFGFLWRMFLFPMMFIFEFVALFVPIALILRAKHII